MRWHEYPKELYKKGLNDPGNHNGVVSHREPDILECEVKQALENITMNKASGADRIPAAPFKMMLLKYYTQYSSNSETQQWPQEWKRSVFIPVLKKDNAKDCSNYCTTALISHTSQASAVC